MKKLSLIFAVLSLLICAAGVSAQKLENLELIPNGSDLLKYGNPDIAITADEFLETFDLGDIVTVTIEGYGEVTVPVCSNYADVFMGEKLLRSAPGKPQICLAVNLGQLGMELGLVEQAPEGSDYAFQVKEGVEFPIRVTIEMKEKGGYADRLALGLLTCTYEKSDYPELSDAEYANFREITTTGMGAGKLYRSSSPVRPDINRHREADEAAKAAGIRTIINQSDSEAVAKAYDGYEGSYYSTQNVIYLALPASLTSDTFKEGFAEGLRFMIANEGPYLMHCSEGKDRVGLASAVLEALMGASLEEIREDYAKSYTNLYDVRDGRQQPLDPEVLSAIREIIVRNLSASFGIEDLSSTDLAEAAENYLLGIGLSAEEIARLKAVLS